MFLVANETKGPNTIKQIGLIGAVSGDVAILVAGAMPGDGRHHSEEQK